MPMNASKILVTQEWLDWFRNTWYQTGVNDERIRQLTEQLEAERQAQQRRAQPQQIKAA